MFGNKYTKLFSKKLLTVGAGRGIILLPEGPELAEYKD